MITTQRTSSLHTSADWFDTCPVAGVTRCHQTDPSPEEKRRMFHDAGEHDLLPERYARSPPKRGPSPKQSQRRQPEPFAVCHATSAAILGPLFRSYEAIQSPQPCVQAGTSYSSTTPEKLRRTSPNWPTQSPASRSLSAVLSKSKSPSLPVRPDTPTSGQVNKWAASGRGALITPAKEVAVRTQQAETLLSAAATPVQFLPGSSDQRWERVRLTTTHKEKQGQQHQAPAKGSPPEALVVPQLYRSAASTPSSKYSTPVRMEAVAAYGSAFYAPPAVYASAFHAHLHPGTPSNLYWSL